MVVIFSWLSGVNFPGNPMTSISRINGGPGAESNTKRILIPVYFIQNIIFFYKLCVGWLWYTRRAACGMI